MHCEDLISEYNLNCDCKYFPSLLKTTRHKNKFLWKQINIFVQNTQNIIFRQMYLFDDNLHKAGVSSYKVIIKILVFIKLFLNKSLNIKVPCLPL